MVVKRMRGSMDSAGPDCCRIALPMNRLPHMKNTGRDECRLVRPVFRGSSMQRRTNLTFAARRRIGGAGRPTRAEPSAPARTSTAAIRDARIARGRARRLACPTSRSPTILPDDTPRMRRNNHLPDPAPGSCRRIAMQRTRDIGAPSATRRAPPGISKLDRS